MSAPLTQRIRDAIRTGGPMPMSHFMLMSLHDPKAGYYATRPGLGRDYTTAPETSQVFGELLGLWAAHEWLQMGSPPHFWLAELGPGRGVMMADVLRAGASVPDFLDAATVALLEASPALRREQAERLKPILGDRAPHFLDDIHHLPNGPAIILGNEFLDCLPVRQFVRDGNDWRERCVGLDGDKLAFGLTAVLPLPAEDVLPVGDSVEIAPGLDTFAHWIGGRCQNFPTRALMIDYGPADRSPGDTLRAYREGAQVAPLADPGACDLTADVDFPRLKHLAAAAGAIVHGPIPQGYFLMRLGARERAQALMAANPARATAIKASVDVLLDREEMGERFKVVAFTSADGTRPPGF